MRASGLLSRGTSLIETLVVIAIMGIMLSLLLPALHMAHESAEETVCENNVWQLDFAMRHFGSTYKRLPPPNRWTIDLLPFLEEKPLYRALQASDPTTVPEAKFLPAIFTCTAQPHVRSFLADTPVCHYMLVIDAPFERRSENIPWRITDRQVDLPSGKLAPWYVGPEMQPAEYQGLVNNERGPHRGGVFFP